MESNEQTALKIIERYKTLFNKHNFRISEHSRNEFSYQVTISDNTQKVNLQVFFGKKGNKVVLQGNKELKLYKIINDLIFGEKFFGEDKPVDEPSHPYIGTDESGKGDYFGPLVIAGVYITPETAGYLKALGIRDSKELSDYQIEKMSAGIKNNNEIIFESVQISPEKYNELHDKMGNLNRLLGWAHARVIENLLNRCDSREAISDKFGNEKIILDALMTNGRTINLTQVTKAEKFIAVAAASVIARQAVVDWFNIQKRKLKVELPKGSSPDVERTAKLIRKKFGEEQLRKLIKLHFKTSKKVFDQEGNDDV